MAALDYEVLHENVYYFPGAIPEIVELMAALEELNSVAVTPWETWYADNTLEGYPYGEVKTLNLQLLDQEFNPEVRAKASYVINTLLDRMHDTCEVFMRAHGATDFEVSLIRKTMFEDNNFYGIRRYNENEDMGPHSDRVVDGRDTYTISVYLDDSYEGGELGISQEGVAVIIKPKAGGIVVFPSGYLHESKMTANGRKTIITHVHTTSTPIIKF